jgi:uncharacterized membrane protein YkoI
VFKVWVLALGLVLNGAAVEAKNIGHSAQVEVQIAEEDQQFPITPSQAANIALDANPGAKVLNVKLLPSGIYAVTLKDGGSVSRVMVDATSGSIG